MRNAETKKYKNCFQNLLAILVTVIFCGSFPGTVYSASLVQITEIMYDLPGADTGREWIEIQNIGTSSIDISTWKLFEANINHKIIAVGGADVPAGGFAVIADVPDKFKIDNPSFAGLLFGSAFSFSNGGETLVLRDQNGADIDTVTYVPTVGAGGDGNSLQKKAGATGALGLWIASTATPGSITVAMQTAITSTSTATILETVPGKESVANSVANVYLASYSSQEVANTSYDAPELEVTTGRPRFGFVGTPLSFEAKIKSFKNAPTNGSSVSTMWAMGDGVEISGKNIDHTYQYPGDYIVIANSDYGSTRAVSKVQVKIAEPSVNIKTISSEYIEISNPDNFEMNVGGYVIANENSRFAVPRDTIIKPRGSLKMSYRVTRLSLGFLMRLMDPSGKERSRMERVEPASLVVDLPPGITADVIRQRVEQFMNTSKK